MSKYLLKDLWCFYEETNGIKGVCVGKDEWDARTNAEYYLKIQFDDIMDVKNLKVTVWEMEKDEDFREDFPYAMAIHSIKLN